MDQSDRQIDALMAWVTDAALKSRGREDVSERSQFLNAFCEQMVNVGLPLRRVHFAQRAFHPQFGGIGFTWMPVGGTSHQHYEHRETPLDAWLRSPLFMLLNEQRDEFRSNLSEADQERFPLLKDLAEEQVSEYVAHSISFGGETTPVDPLSPPEGILMSWATDQVGGFTEAQINIIRRVLPVLSLGLKAMADREMARDLLQVYLGRDAGRRVLSGEIQRGTSREINAVVCLFDLQGFTSLAERIPGTELIEMLNDYFGIVVAVTQAHGGNILKFLGDGVLTMFDIGELQEDVRAGLGATSVLRQKMQARNKERAALGLPVTDFTLALHAGNILYGNIGAENRLDFTVIGPIVNQTARIAGLHGAVGQNVILSEDVRDAAPADCPHDLVSLGRYMLRGVPDPMELFTIYEI